MKWTSFYGLWAGFYVVGRRDTCPARAEPALYQSDDHADCTKGTCNTDSKSGTNWLPTTLLRSAATTEVSPNGKHYSQDTPVFSIEDDAQHGGDRVDAHGGIAFVARPDLKEEPGDFEAPQRY